MEKVERGTHLTLEVRKRVKKYGNSIENRKSTQKREKRVILLKNQEKAKGKESDETQK